MSKKKIKKRLTTFQLSEHDFRVFEMLTDYFEVSKVALLRKWIHAEAREMMKHVSEPFKEAAALRLERFEQRQLERLEIKEKQDELARLKSFEVEKPETVSVGQAG